jgi:hypothetical protein
MEFNVRIRRNPEQLIDQVCTMAEDRVVVSGNSRRGHFTGWFDGSYEVEGDQVSLRIRRKPMFVTWSMVEKGLEYLSA